MSFPPHPEIARQLGVEGNPQCVCATPIDTMACPWGHVDGCHFPKECWQAQCEHFLSTADPDFIQKFSTASRMKISVMRSRVAACVESTWTSASATTTIPRMTTYEERADMAILINGNAELGYCHQCGRAEVVLPLELNGWKHVFRICSRCLGHLQAEVDKSAISIHAVAEARKRS